MTPTNLQALYEAIWDIEDNPEGWDQKTYGKQTECGTFGCLAYRICERAGYSFEADGYGDLFVIVPGGRFCATMDVAIGVLGITIEDAHHLFHAYNRLSDLYADARDIALRHKLPVPDRSKPGMKGH
jgi:hypothetical protein